MPYEAGRFPERIVALDYDGTLVQDANPEHGQPIPEMQALTDRLRNLGYHLLINTSRDSLAVPTIAETTGIEEVHTGKPIADLYLDDKGLLPPLELVDAFVEQYFDTQKDYLDKLTSGKLDSGYARNMANVPENPEYKERQDEDFRIYIPLTGGMDSTTLWQMGVESGLPLKPIYLKCGQVYADLEIKVAESQARDAGYKLEVIEAEMPFKSYEHILLGRNAVVLYTIASLMKERGEWGEIWFGNLSGESPILNGDKSRRFFNDTQSLLSMRGYDVRICNPLIGMDKPDEVAFWKTRDIDKLVDTKSCFSADKNQCGCCQTCFRKWVAFKTHDIEVRDTFDDPDIATNFAPYVEKYKRVMGKAREEGDYSHYSPARIATTLTAISALEAENNPNITENQ